MIERKTIGKLNLPAEVAQVSEECPSYKIFSTIEELFEAAAPTEKEEEWFDVKFSVEGKGEISEAQICRVKNRYSR